MSSRAISARAWSTGCGSAGETIEIDIAAQPGCWPAIADPGQVENALLNLALNARDAMPSGGKLRISCANARLDGPELGPSPETKVGEYTVLTVSDTGCGMTPDHMQRAFEPFFTTKEVGQGSGLGLSMVYGFAKQSGGHATIASETGKGTSVTLYLPRAVHRPDAGVPPKPAEMPGGHGEVVLVIEDDPDVRHLTVQMLETLGYRVFSASEAASARSVIEDGRRIDVLLSDIMLLGKMSGPEFAEEARRRLPDLKILFMSGYPADAVGGRDGHNVDALLLNKPFRKRQLAEALRKTLDGEAGRPRSKPASRRAAPSA